MKTFLFLLLLSCYCFAENLININFKDLKLKELVNITSKTINKSILVTDKLDGKVDFISNEPLEKNKLLTILKFSLESNGYKLIESHNILRVVKNDLKTNNEFKKAKEIVVKKIVNTPKIEKQKIDIDETTEIIYLTNIEVKSLEKLLKLLLDTKKSNILIAFDEEFNSVILNGNNKDVLRVKSIIQKLDVVKKQVYVKAHIIELDNNLLEDIGLKFGILGGKAYSGGLYTFASSLNNGDAIIDITNLNLDIPNISSSLALGATLSLLNKTYALNVISQPSILCINNKESSIYVGETVSIQTGSSTTDGGTTKINYEREDIGLTLKVKPRVSQDNRVLIEINTILEGIKNENFTNSNPDTTKKEVKTTAMVNNGESVIIGGLIENKNQKTIQKIPFAGDIPLIGELFKNRLNDVQNRSLVLIVTPYVIPQNRDLTFVRNELSKLKTLEDKFLEQVLIYLKSKKTEIKKKKVVKSQLSDEQKHKQRMREYFNIN